MPDHDARAHRVVAPAVADHAVLQHVERIRQRRVPKDLAPRPRRLEERVERVGGLSGIVGQRALAALDRRRVACRERQLLEEDVLDVLPVRRVALHDDQPRKLRERRDGAQRVGRLARQRTIEDLPSGPVIEPLARRRERAAQVADPVDRLAVPLRRSGPPSDP